MAIAFDNKTGSGNFGAASSGNVTHVTTGSNMLMVVVTHAASANNTVASITYNGTSFATAGGIVGGRNGNTRRTEFWYFMGPATGSHTVTVTMNGTLAAWGYDVATYSGVAQASALDVSTTVADAATMTGTVTTTVDNDWLIGGVGANGTLTVGANTTSRGFNGTFDGSGWGIVDSNADKTPTGSYSLVVNDSTVGNGGLIVGAFKPATGGVIVVANNLALLGVG